MTLDEIEAQAVINMLLDTLERTKTNRPKKTTALLDKLAKKQAKAKDVTVGKKLGEK